MLGMNYYRAELREQVNIEAATDLKALIAALEALLAPSLRGSNLPVVEAKLDQWSAAVFWRCRHLRQ